MDGSGPIKHAIKKRNCHPPDKAGSIAVVTVGNTLRGDDGVALAVVDAMSPETRRRICRFDVGSYTNHLLECLDGHDCVIVIDAIQQRSSPDSSPGSTVVIDLSSMIDSHEPMPVASCHGFSLVDEIRLGRRNGMVPGVLKLFGVEVMNVDWGEGLSSQVSAAVPAAALNLETLIDSLYREAPGNA